MNDFAQVLLRRSSGDPGEVLSNRSLHGPLPVLNRRSCGDRDKIFAKILRTPCIAGASLKALQGFS